jgi:type II secretory pathway pseudopilin PulG
MRGFTLIETLIYCALFGIIMSGALSGIWALSASADRSQTHALLEMEGNFLLQKIEYDLQHSETISEPANTDNATTSELVLTSDSGTYIEFYLADAALQRTEDHESAQLSSDNVAVHDLSFIRAGTGGSDPLSIEVHFEISAVASNGQTVSEDFSTTQYLSP